MIAIRQFTGIVNGKEKSWTVGDKIDDADAKAMDLAHKPDLAKAEKGAKK